MLCLILLVAVGPGLLLAEPERHCFPGSSCWPQAQDFYDFMATLDGKALFTSDSQYHEEVTMIDTRLTRFPYVIVMAVSQDDVINSIKFANKHRIRITVRSSGHDYIGRSTADGSLQINLKNMKKLEFDLNSKLNPAGILRAESGNTWLRVYNESSKHQRSIVGGSAHTVSMGGYTLGGGHSPIGRKFGMAVDNLLSVEMVAANGSVVIANATHVVVDNRDGGHKQVYADSDLFWALRGGGGSTFGVVTTFTFKLHYDSKMVTLGCSMPYNDYTNSKPGQRMLQDFNHLLGTTLAPEWGGYEIIFGGYNPQTYTLGTTILYLNHYGEYGSASFNSVLPFLTKYTTHCQVKNYTSFLEYEINAHDDLYTQSYVFNVLMEPEDFTDAFYDYTYNVTTSAPEVEGGVGCTGTLIGGNMHKVAPDATAVTPTFRKAVLSLSCGLGWKSLEESQHIAAGEKLAEGMLRFGHGTYFNEPSAHLPNWQARYWGGHYSRLLNVKHEWDPANVFSCFHCVGSEENDGMTQNPSTIIG